MNCRAALIICENLGRWRAKATYTVHAGQIFEIKNIDLHLLKAWRTPTIQTVTEHRAGSTDQRYEYLNGYMTVQHHSFRKPSLLDPQSSRLDPRISKLKLFELQDVRIESRVSSIECQLTFERYCRSDHSLTEILQTCMTVAA